MGLVYDKLLDYMTKRGDSRAIQDGGRAAGGTNVVQRRGDRVLRPSGYWTPAVHELLHHLERVSYRYAPRALELGEEVETLTYMFGLVSTRPWPEALRQLSGLEHVALALCQYHQAVVDFVPSRRSWRDPQASWEPGMVVRHGDWAPWNMVWDADEFVGVIDWDMAQPGRPSEDVAQLAWHSIPLKPRRQRQQAGMSVQAQRERLHLVCSLFELSPGELVTDVLKLQHQEVEHMLRLSANDVPPWRRFANRGDPKEIRRESQWLRQAYPQVWDP